MVCATCDRYAEPRAVPSRGERMITALRAAAGTAPVTLRVVECLNGCTRPCTVALRAIGKASLRFSGCAPEDARALLELAESYAASADGEVMENAPPTLRARLTVHTPAPRQGGAGAMTNDPHPALLRASGGG